MKPKKGRLASERRSGRGSPGSRPHRGGGDQIKGLRKARFWPGTSPGPATQVFDQPPHVWWDQGWLLSLVLVVGIFIAYQPVWQAGFIWDDDDHLTQNPCIVGPLGFKAIWTTSAAIYYPLVLTSFWVEHACWGLDPLPYHVVNVALHAAGALLLWRVLRNLSVRGAWLGAALWALHPVQVESVAWITELKNTQSCLFYLLAILFFLKWLAPGAPGGRRGNEWNYALTLVCATLAILSKASTVMLPVALGLCWWWLEGRWRWRNALRLTPFLLISGLASGWTIWEQRFHSGAAGSEWAQTWPERWIIAGKAAWFYLEKLFWPHPLIFIYPRWTLDASRPAAYLPALGAAIALFLLWWMGGRRAGFAPALTPRPGGAGILAGVPVSTKGAQTSRSALRWLHAHWKPARPGFFAFAYYLVLLFPVLGFFNIYFFRYSFVGDHFQYLASMAPLALAAAGITTVLGRLTRANRFLYPALCVTLLLVLGGLTWQQSRMYRDNETLFRTTLDRNPDCWIAVNNLGLVLLATGRHAEAKSRLEAALALKPDYAEAHNNLGGALDLLGQRPAAIEHYQRAIQLKPDYTQAWVNLALDYFLGARTAEGVTAAQKALELARSKGQTGLAQRLEPWLAIYQQSER